MTNYRPWTNPVDAAIRAGEDPTNRDLAEMMLFLASIGDLPISARAFRYVAGRLLRQNHAPQGIRSISEHKVHHERWMKLYKAWMTANEAQREWNERYGRVHGSFDHGIAVAVRKHKVPEAQLRQFIRVELFKKKKAKRCRDSKPLIQT